MVVQYTTIKADRADTWMIYRKKMRFAKLLWITLGWLYLINAACLTTRFPACISSRITTVIHILIHQINYNWFNEPFAVSRYITILTHAWVNLWDKHMTTGRINQVTTKLRVTSEHYVHSRNIIRISNLPQLARATQTILGIPHWCFT